MFPNIRSGFGSVSIKFKAAFAATAGVLIVFVVVTALETSRVRSDMREAIGSQQLTLIARIAAELDDKIRLTHRALIVTAEAIPPELMNDPTALERRLQGQPGVRAVFDDVLVFGIDGKVLVDLPKLDRVGIDYVKNRLLKDDEGRKGLHARFLLSQRFVQDDPWAERAHGKDAHEFSRLPELAGA